MLRIRKVADATTVANRTAIEAAQKIMREQFSAMPEDDIAKLSDQLSNPLKHRFGLDASNLNERTTTHGRQESQTASHQIRR